MAETIYKVKLTEENNYHVKRETEPTEVKILMVKGEKGEKGEKGDPGEIDDLKYSDLPDKPQINDVTLEGNKSFEDLGAETLTNIEINNIINSIV